MEKARSPDAVPAQYEQGREELEKTAVNVYDTYAIPYSLQVQMAQQGYTTLQDLADRWDTPEKAREKSPKALKFDHANNAAFSEEEEDHLAMRMLQATRRAQQLTKQWTGQTQIQTGGPSTATDAVIMQNTKRATMEARWKTMTGLDPPQMDEQGSDQMVKKQWEFCEMGRIGHMDLKHIISNLPDPRQTVQKRKRKSLDGIMTEYDEDEAWLPREKHDWEHQIKVYTNNLLMVMFCFPQLKVFDLTKKDVDEWYKFLLGRTIATRTPPPSLDTLMHAERLVWREVEHGMHQGESSKTALRRIQGDSLFWQREVYEKLQKGGGRGNWNQNYRGNYKGQNAYNQNYYNNSGGGRNRTGGGKYNGGGKNNSGGYKGKSQGKGKKGRFAKGNFKNANKGKGKGKGRGKGKKGKGGKSNYSPNKPWPENWAKTTKTGQQFCANYLFRTCPGDCGKSHTCPVTTNGWVCQNPSHNPKDCPNASG